MWRKKKTVWIARKICSLFGETKALKYTALNEATLFYSPIAYTINSPIYYKSKT